MKRFSRRGVHVGVIAVLTAAALVAVVLHPGMVAHLSYCSQTLNRGLRTSSTSFDVDQSSSQVVMSDASSDTYTQIDDITPPRATGSGSTVPTLVSRRFRP